jgi:hypothetical protein
VARQEVTSAKAEAAGITARVVRVVRALLLAGKTQVVVVVASGFMDRARRGRHPAGILLGPQELTAVAVAVAVFGLAKQVHRERVVQVEPTVLPTATLSAAPMVAAAQWSMEAVVVVVQWHGLIIFR